MMNTITTVSPPLPDDQVRKALETFITDNPDLERLESLLSQFNIFEAIGAVRHEVRHSDFLAYLLNPQENHGLSDAFVKCLLQKVIASASGANLLVTPTEIDAWDFSGAAVQREWQRIDVFLRDESHQFSVIIENKIDTGEHDDQLSRYYERVRLEYPGDRILALYLTKEGDDPTDDRYCSIGYELVCEAVERLALGCASVLNPDVRTLMTHYVQMLRRHILSDTEIARLCGLIYQKHRTALDLIYEHRPSQQAGIGLYLQAMLKTTPGFNAGPLTKNSRYLGFNWQNIQHPNCFVFHNFSDSLSLLLQIMPGDQQIRQQLFDFASRHQPPFVVKQRRLVQWTTIYTRRFLTATDYVEYSS